MTHDEERALAQVASEAIAELRARRRWKIFFRFLWLTVFALLVLGVVLGGTDSKGHKYGPHIGVVQVHGLISNSDYASAENVVDALNRAFASPDSVAVFLDIDSPGGSPVQSSQIYRAVSQLKKQYKKPVYAVIGDMGASGAYYIAAAADKIFADPASLVGSIGVIFHSYGIGDLLEKIGVDARTITSGKHKDFLSMTEPLKPEEVAHMQAMLATIHAQFRDAVKNGRGERLKDEEYPEVFSGLFWSGEQAQTLGLVDGLLDMRELARIEFDDAPLQIYEPPLSPWEALQHNFAAEGKVALRQALGVGQKINAVFAE